MSFAAFTGAWGLMLMICAIESRIESEVRSGNGEIMELEAMRLMSVRSYVRQAAERRLVHGVIFRHPRHRHSQRAHIGS